MLCMANENHVAALEKYVKCFDTQDLVLAFYGTCQDAKAYLHMMMAWHREQALPEGIVGSTLYFWIEKDEILGTILLRHELNEYLRRIGGHIGYSVAPLHRRKGIAKKMLLEVKDIAKQTFRIEKCLVSCLQDNLASRNTILSCGGTLLRITTEKGNSYELYELGGK